jgi:outer membrane protein OmpA-like peptidoglycan-associated protein
MGNPGQIRKRGANVKKDSNEEPCRCGDYGPFCSSYCDSAADENPPPTCTTHFVYFSTSSHALTPEDRNHIRDVAALMQSTPTFVATIVGKTDSVGSADFNAHLSQRRAEAVFEDLVYANKVPENRVQLHWTGEYLPFTSTADEKAEAQNRMVAIIVSNGASEHCGG